MNFAGCHHDVEAPIDVNNHGVLYLNSHVGYDDITDGPAYTILLGETGAGALLGWASGTRDTLRNTGMRINAPEPFLTTANIPSSFSGDLREELEELAGPAGVFPPRFVGGFASAHGLGANFLFCDGSVRLLTERIDPRVFRCLGHRFDGEVISGEQY